MSALRTGVEDLRPLPAGIVRGRRSPPVRPMTIVGILILLAVVAAVVALARDTQHDAGGRGCPPGATTVNRTLPGDASEVTLRVLNGTGVTGVADKVSTDFQNRGFRMRPPATGKETFEGVAVVRYGPATVGAAQWIRAHFLGEAQPEYDRTRSTDVIDVVVGARFQQLATQTEVSQALALLGEPPLPPGTCENPAR